MRASTASGSATSTPPEREQLRTSAPAAWSACAIACPTPRVPPVTTANCPLRSTATGRLYSARRSTKSRSARASAGKASRSNTTRTGT